MRSRSAAAANFPTEYVKATPEVLCGVYQPTFLYELLWNLLVAVVVVWADQRFQLGGGRAFAVYVAGYTLGRIWIEMLRIDPANHFFGVRINVYTSVLVFVGAVLFLILRRHVGREDPAVVWGPDRPGNEKLAGGRTERAGRRCRARRPKVSAHGSRPAAEATDSVAAKAAPRRPRKGLNRRGCNAARDRMLTRW